MILANLAAVLPHEIALAESHKLPSLVTLKDIHAELHAHTTASDGKWTIRELVQEPMNTRSTGVPAMFWPGTSQAAPLGPKRSIVP